MRVDACIVHEHVEAAELMGKPLAGSRYLIIRANIRGKHMGCSGRRANGLCRLLERLACAPADHHGGAVRRQSPGNHRTDPLPATGHGCHLAAQVEQRPGVAGRCSGG